MATNAERREKTRKRVQGKRYGRLVALHPVERENSRGLNSPNFWWKCRCDCGKTLVVRLFALEHPPRKGGKGQQSCGCLKMEVFRRTIKRRIPIKCSTCGKPVPRSLSQAGKITFCSKACRLPHDHQYHREWELKDKLSSLEKQLLGRCRTLRQRQWKKTTGVVLKDLLAKASAQQNACLKTRMPFELATRGPWRVSVDRIDPQKGYTNSNTRLVSWIYNMTKRDWTDADVMTFCKAVVKHNKLSLKDGPPSLPTEHT